MAKAKKQAEAPAAPKTTLQQARELYHTALDAVATAKNLLGHSHMVDVDAPVHLLERVCLQADNHADNEAA